MIVFVVCVRLIRAGAGAEMFDHKSFISFLSFVFSEFLIFVPKFESWDGASLSDFVPCVTLVRTGVGVGVFV